MPVAQRPLRRANGSPFASGNSICRRLAVQTVRTPESSHLYQRAADIGGANAAASMQDAYQGAGVGTICVSNQFIETILIVKLRYNLSYFPRRTRQLAIGRPHDRRFPHREFLPRWPYIRNRIAKLPIKACGAEKSAGAPIVRHSRQHRISTGMSQGAHISSMLALPKYRHAQGQRQHAPGPGVGGGAQTPHACVPDSRRD